MPKTLRSQSAAPCAVALALTFERLLAVMVAILRKHPELLSIDPDDLSRGQQEQMLDGLLRICTPQELELLRERALGPLH